MRLSSTLAAPLFVLLAAGGSSAAVGATSIEDVLSLCPTEARVGSCANAVIDFVSARPAGADRNAEIVDLVAALAAASRDPRITPYMCAELQEAILVAGSQVTLAAPRGQIEDLAASLCLGDIDETTTAGIGGASGSGDEDDDGPPPSLSDTSGITETPPPPPPPPAGDDGGEEGGDDGEGDPPPPPPIVIE